MQKQKEPQENAGQMPRGTEPISPKPPRFYVDAAIIPKDGKRWCHLMTDGEEPDLFRFGLSLGLKAPWFQKAGEPGAHWDLTEAKREKAIQAGAVPVSALELLRYCVLPKRVPLDTGRLARLDALIKRQKEKQKTDVIARIEEGLFNANV